ncbi:MAG: RNA polymerase sigma factor [Spirochaetes bacterium]|nr:RNA polymerase sigma factor [Spirochaetota bacterium]
MTNLTEAEIIKKVVDGHISLYGDLVELYQQRLFRYIYSQVRNYDDALEIAQDVFIAALEALGKFRGEAKFSTWLFSIASNQCKTHLKKKKRTSTVPLNFIAEDGKEADFHLEDVREDIEHFVINDDLLEKAYDELIKMPPEYKEILILRDIEEMAYDDIVKILGISMSNVKVRIHRGREMLKKRLAARGLI